MFYYATLTQVHALKGLGASDTGDDALLTDFLASSTDWITQWKGRRYDVRQETRYFDVPANPARRQIGYYPGLSNNGSENKLLRLDDDLLSIVTLTNGDETVIPAAGYLLEPGNKTPKSAIRLQSGYSWVADDDGEMHQVISVNGLWGFHDRYSAAWVDSLEDVGVGGITANATSFTVTNINGAAADLASPRFQAGQLICIDSEFMLILSAVITSGPTAHTLTVERAYNGTTAAAHTAGKMISIFRPMPIVVEACRRLVQWRYSQKDVDNFDRTYVLGSGMVSVPTALPSDVRAFLGARKARL